MRSFYSTLNVFLIFIATTQYAHSTDEMSWDSISDQQIKSCLHSDTFQNISFLYSYEHQNWELRVIFNPKYEKIELSNGHPSMFQFYYGVFSKDIIPESLESHLKDIIKNQLENSSGGHWSISSTVNGRLAIDYFAGAVALGTGRSESDTPNEAFKKPIQINEEYTSLDQEVYDLFKAKTFEKLSLDYQWEGKSYPVHFVYNPMREFLFCSELSTPVRWSFAVTIEASSYPLSLAKHIKNLVPGDLLNDTDSIIDIADWVSYFRKHPISLYKTLNPIPLLNKIENSDIDAEIQALFTSSQLTRKSLYYELNETLYSVLLVHNPEKLNLKSTLGFDTWENGRLSYTATWNSKIGIFVDKKAPQELINHISQLYELSWWDNYWNISIHNGDKISISYAKYSWTYTYTPYSWYAFMLNAKP